MIKIIEKSIDELIPYENNARINDKAVEYVAKSIKEFGFKNPIIIDKDNVIVAGHTRLKALQKLGIETAPCIVVDDLTEEQIKAFRIADNSTAQIADWDLEKLNTELASIDLDMTMFGLDEQLKEIEREFAPEIIEDEVPEVSEGKAVAELGDIWQLDRHRLMCGDSTKEEDVAKLMNEENADISFTSPPYNAGSQHYYGSNESKYEKDNDNKTEEEYRAFLNKYLNCAISFSQYVFCNIQSLAGNKLALIDFLYDNKNLYADTMIWDKQHGQPAMGRNVLNSAFEYIHIFSKKAKRSIGVKDFRGTIDNVLRMSSQRGNEYAKIHNATFSVVFASFFVQNFSIQSVLDLFGGTGTTLIACEQLNRNCYMMELDPKYCDVIIKRWEKFTGKKAEKIN